MRRIIPWIAIITICVSCSPRKPVGASRILLVPIGAVDTETVEAVSRLVSGNIGRDVVVQRLSVDLRTDPKKAAQGLSSKLPENDICMLVLIGGSDDTRFRAAAFRDERVGFLNVTALDPGSDAQDRAMVHRRRVMKESVRLVGLLCGMEDCPFPRCVMYAHSSLEELDNIKGGDFCPPCQEKLSKLLPRNED